MYIHVYKKGKYQADPGGCKKSLPSVCTSDNPHPPRTHTNKQPVIRDCVFTSGTGLPLSCTGRHVNNIIRHLLEHTCKTFGTART